MGYKLERKSSGTEYEKVPEGNHRCCIVAVTELGTQTEKAYKGEGEVSRFKIHVVYELLDEERADPNKSGPYVIGHVYTASDFEDAPIVKAFVAAMQRPVKKDEVPDVEKMVGKVVMVEVVHQQGKADPAKVYDKVKSVSQVAAGLKKMPVNPVNPPAYFALGSYVPHDWHPRIFGAKIEDYIALSAEAQAGDLKGDAADDGEDAFADVGPAGKEKPGDDDVF